MNRVLQLFLVPLSVLWDLVYRLRRTLFEYGVFKKEYFKVPVVSVGNITFGGTGKTPMIIWLVEYIEQIGKQSMVLTRGYKGDLEDSRGIIKGGQRFRSNPKKFGDEPILISRRMKHGAVVVGKKRSDNLKFYFDEIKPDIILLDDGFQHLKLYRSFNIVLFDSLLTLSKYKTAPMGYLREGLSALKDADFIIFTRADQADDKQVNKLEDLVRTYAKSNIQVAKCRYRPGKVRDSSDQVISDITGLEGKKIIAMTGIASPESFYRLIESCGAEIVKKLEFADHHLFTEEDVKRALELSELNNAMILTSEKDIVKIRRVSLDARIKYLDVELEFISGEDKFLSSIRKVINLD